MEIDINSLVSIEKAIVVYSCYARWANGETRGKALS